jgi:hypothetical protein
MICPHPVNRYVEGDVYDVEMDGDCLCTFFGHHQCFFNSMRFAWRCKLTYQHGLGIVNDWKTIDHPSFHCKRCDVE